VLRARRPALLALFGLLLVSLLAASGMTYLLASERGNRWLCNYVSEQVGKAFAGRMEIDRIQDLRLDSIDARGVRFFPPRSEVAAIDAPRVQMQFSAWEMLRGQYGWKRADIDQPIVRVTEPDDHGKTNMEALFASPKKEDPSKPKDNSGSPVSMQTMVTRDATLLIYGGSMPKLDLTHLDGVMRIDVSPDGDAVLRFDDYQGHLAGLPTGELDFQKVKGQVWTGGKHLLHFDGTGKSKGEPVDFALDIASKPTDVRIKAAFAEVTAASLSAGMVAAWTKFSPSIDLDVSQHEP
jgi:uncharacterized protein involved in outer membrane biogenesis